MRPQGENTEKIFHESVGRDLRVNVFGYNDFSTQWIYKLWRQTEDNVLHIVLKGKGTLVLNQTKYRIGEKQVFCVPKDMLCKYYPDEDDPWVYMWINFDGAIDGELIRRAGFSADNPVKLFDKFYRVENEIAELIDDTANGECGYLSVLGLLYTVLDLLSEERAAGTIRQSNQLVAQMKKNIETHYVDPTFNVSLLCKMLFVSDAYASRLFKKNEGMTVKNYLMRTRLLAAKNLLAQSDCTVKEVARRCGYGDYEHFVKEFKRFTGMTAKEYRLGNSG